LSAVDKGDVVTQHTTLSSTASQSGWPATTPDSSAWSLLAPQITAGSDPTLFAPVSSMSAPPGSGGASAATTSASGQIVNSNSLSPFSIHITYDSQANANASLKSAVSAAVTYLESVITTAITISIQIGWGELAGGAFNTGTQAVGESSGNAFNDLSYGTVVSALSSHATSAEDQTAVATLPNKDPTNGTPFWVSSAEAKALGIGNSYPSLDGYVSLNSFYPYTWDHTAASGMIDAVGVLEHEITEVMGRIGSAGTFLVPGTSYYTPLDLFRYSSAGTRDLTPTSSSTDYFSADGQTMLTQFNNPTHGGDVADWASTVQGDAFGSASYNTVLSVTPTDLSLMDLIGYTLAPGVACFAAGSRIATEHGEVAVEALRAGDRVQAQFAGLSRVTWVGQRRIDCARHPDPLSVMPVRVAPHAFGPGLPRRAVLLSPEHAVGVDGVLVPIRFLINGGSIRQETMPRPVHYFHVELERHDLLSVEGLPAESYLDTGNRTVFGNAGGVTALHLLLDNSQARREDESCLPLLLDPDRLEPLWQRHADRARQLGFVLPGVETTDDAMLHLAIDGRALFPVARDATRCRFVLPAPAGAARLTSRQTIPAATRPWLDDRRQLGVMVRGITFHGPDGATELAVDDPRLRDGWWAAEADQATIWRWTNGNAVLPLPSGTRVVELRLGTALNYPLPVGARQAQEAA